MSEEYQLLDAINVPIEGNILIEASAGTGKTFTITTLVMRLLLGLVEGRNAIPIEEILLVTFTRAATEELKERIYRRIVELKSALLFGESDDPVLSELVAAIELQGEEEAIAAINRLIEAERSIDQAAIFTIHGFCQRVIVKNAFSAALPFEAELVQRVEPLEHEAAYNFWRKECYYFSKDLAQFANQYYKDPISLLKKIRPYLKNPNLLVDRTTVMREREQLETKILELKEQVNSFKEEWALESENLKTALLESPLRQNSYSPSQIEKKMVAITEWQLTTSLLPPIDELSFFSITFIQSRLRKGGVLIEHPLFHKVEKLIEFVETFDFETELLLFAAYRIDKELKQIKLTHQKMGFNDILIRLYDALKDTPELLRRELHQQYQAVMIDEFQDTDEYQFFIFNELFFKEPSIPFIMIGDPKQSIYKFRGADIFVYLQAKERADNIYTLGVNYRSTESLIQAVNHLFTFKENPFKVTDIPFMPVQSHKKGDQEYLKWSEVDSKEGITFLSTSTSGLVSEARLLIAHQMAREVEALLKEGRFVVGGEESVVTPKDITFLVRSGGQAEIIKEVLRSYGINSVYLSERSNVFQSPIAADLLLLFKSLAHPYDARLAKQLLASPLYGISIREYQEVIQTPALYEAYLIEREELKLLWNSSGPLSMIRHFLMSSNRLARLRSLPEGERYVTDLLHLSELLEAQQFLSSELLLQWLASQIDEEGETEEERTLRLESDFESVQILTIHKSKGLEFPIVFYPYPFELIRRERSGTFYNPHLKRLDHTFKATEEEEELLYQESFAEEIRLFYVAITRAKYHCRIGYVSNAKSSSNAYAKNWIAQRTVLGELLMLEPEKREIPQALFQDRSIGVVEIKEELPQLGEISLKEDSSSLVAATFTGSIEREWRFTSFSHLAYNAESTFYSNDALQDEVILQRKDELRKEGDPIVTLDYPKGAEFGNFLHDLFEHLPPEALSCAEQISKEIEGSTLRHELLDKGDVLAQWLADVLNHPLDSDLTLFKILSAGNHLKELEFLFPVEQLLTPQQITQALTLHRGERGGISHFNFTPLIGMLRGFIDLIFLWEGRYYICDYKSNFLGEYYHNYSQDALQDAVAAANYDWQYLLYTVALVRFLKRIDSTFSYERDFGGVYYLFLRGMGGEESTNGVYFNRPEESTVAMLDKLFSGGESDNI